MPLTARFGLVQIQRKWNENSDNHHADPDSCHDHRHGCRAVHQSPDRGRRHADRIQVDQNTRPFRHRRRIHQNVAGEQRGYIAIMLDPDTVSGRLATTPIRANIQLTPNAKNRMKAMASAIWMTRPRAGSPVQAPCPGPRLRRLYSAHHPSGWSLAPRPVAKRRSKTIMYPFGNIRAYRGSAIHRHGHDRQDQNAGQ